MRAPIIINVSNDDRKSGDLRVYDSIEAAERSLERYDADEPDIHAYDSEGLLLRIYPLDDGGAYLAPARDKPTHANVLREIVADFLLRSGCSIQVGSMTLDALIQEAIQVAPKR